MAPHPQHPGVDVRDVGLSDGSTGQTFTVRWREPNGTKPRRTFDSLQDALDFRAKRQTAKRWRPEELRQERAGKTTLADFFSEWWVDRAMVELKRSTLAVYRCLWHAHCVSRIGAMPLRQIDARVVVRFRGELLAAGVGPTSVVKTMAMLQCVFRDAVEYGEDAFNPFKAVQKPSPGPSREAQPLSPLQVERLAGDNHHRVPDRLRRKTRGPRGVWSPPVTSLYGERMIAMRAGTVALSDRRTRRRWTVALAPYALAAVPVTRAQYDEVLGRAGSGCDGDVPVVDVSWLEAVRFCNALSRRASLAAVYEIAAGEVEDVGCDLAADGYRLPSEAEWEYACRAGTTGPRYGELADIAWYRGNAQDAARPVGGKTPNAWGLHDMLGNVWEWCWDIYDPEVYGSYRVLRGGGWMDEHWSCRASVRRRSHPSFQIDDVGFRVARTIDRDDPR